MMSPLPSPIESLFERQPALTGFSVRGAEDVPDSCPRSEDDCPLFVGDIGIAHMITEKQYAEIFRDVIGSLAELLAAEPEVAESLRGRTFARVLH